jgi:glycosyltransferase involved in cell wall biosynthesis
MEKDLKLALSMIAAETEPVEMIKRAIGSVAEAIDGIFVTVTYKTEQPKDTELLKFLDSIGAKVSFFKWIYRFDEARNFAASQIPDEYDFYMWMDVDDVWQNPEKIRPLMREAYVNNIGAIFFEYLYMVELDENGKIREVLVQHKRERIIRNDGAFKWIGRLHETLIEQRNNVLKVYKPDCLVVHLSDDKRTDSNLVRNIEILEKALEEEEGKDPRTVMYLGKAYFDRGKGQTVPEEKKRDYALSESCFIKYLAGKGTPGVDYTGGSGWADERSSAWQYLSEIYRDTNQMNNAVRANANALIESPYFPNYYLDMAMDFLMMGDHKKAETWLNIAKMVPIPDTTLIITPHDIKARALEIDYQIAIKTNDLERAKKASEKLLEIVPGNKGLKDRFDSINAVVEYNKAAQSLVYLGRMLEKDGQIDKLTSLVQAIPKQIENEQFAAQMRNKFMPSRLWDKDEITILCGPGFEAWSPKSVDKGIGGSEAAVIYAAKELAKLGYRVTVYGDPRDDQGMHDGVNYLPWYFLNVKDTFNILLVWRAIGFLDSGVQARQMYLWAHDVPTNPDFTEKRMENITKIFALSKYHRSLFMMQKDKELVDIPDDKFLITGNGSLYYDVEEVKRDPHRMIYASSYDRGLVHLLNIWPTIRREVPDATLHIFYGWQTYDAIFRDNPERQLWKSRVEKMMQQDGITHHGRVSHKELVGEFTKSAIFTYPTDFQEISCQNAMTAQIYGAIPVVSDYAALKETVQFGKKIDADITSSEGKQEYAHALVEALTNEKWQEEERAKMIPWAKKEFTWSKIAKQWKKVFDADIVKEISIV